MEDPIVTANARIVYAFLRESNSAAFFCGFLLGIANEVLVENPRVVSDRLRQFARELDRIDAQVQSQGEPKSRA